MVGKKRKHFRFQYDGDESRQRKASKVRRQATGRKGREKQQAKLMDQQQYTVLERVTTKTQLEEVLQVLKTPAKKEETFFRYDLSCRCSAGRASEK